MIDVTLDPSGLEQVRRLQRQNRLLLEALEQRQTTPLGRLVAFLTRGLSEATEAEAPEDTSATKAAHWADIAPDASRGLVFLNPNVQNPRTGARPADYGPIVHQRDPWFARAMTNRLPAILERGGSAFLDELCAIHEGGAA